VTFEVCGGSASQDAGAQQPANDQCRRFRLSKTDCHVETVGHHVAQTVARHQFQAKRGVGLQYAPRRGTRKSRAKVGSTLTRSCPRATPEIFCAPSATSSNWANSGRASSQNAFPSSVRRTIFEVRSKNPDAQPLFQSLNRPADPDWVNPSASPARTKLLHSMTAARTGRPERKRGSEAIIE